MTQNGKRKCQHCSIFFLPDYRNANRQNFCDQPECRKASKAASQAKWHAKNPDYFKGAVHVERVKEWRRANPGHRHPKAYQDVLQEPCPQKTSQNQEVVQQSPPAGKPPEPVLQDVCLTQHPVIVGLISHLTGLVLQDDIASVALRLEKLGLDVLTGSTSTKGGNHDPKVSDLPRPNSDHPRTVQLGGSPAGP
jgi:hypothetical protein